MRKVSSKSNLYALDVYYQKELVGHFGVQIVETQILSEKVFRITNKQAEQMFREESMYGIKDLPGLDRDNKSLIGGFGSFEPYPTLTSKAAALWYKIASSQFFYNGNKRTAMISAIYLLASNFYSFDVANANLLYDISLSAANNKIGPKEIEKFINSHISLSYDNMASALKNGTFEYSHSFTFKSTIKM